MMPSIRFIVLLVALVPTLVAAESHAIVGDATAGEAVFRKCMACHQVGADAKPNVGPVLNAVIGRTIGTTDFAYSEALLAMGTAGDNWTPEVLDAFLTNPRDFAAGTKMNFIGLRRDADRANVIAYLATFTDEGT